MRDLHVFITSLDGETRHSHGLSARWDYECNQLLRFFLFLFFLLLSFGESGKRMLIIMMMIMIMTKAGNDFVDLNIRYKANGYDPNRVAGEEQGKGVTSN